MRGCELGWNRVESVKSVKSVKLEMRVSVAGIKDGCEIGWNRGIGEIGGIGEICEIGDACFGGGV